MEIRAIIRTMILMIGGLIVLAVLLTAVPVILLILFIWSLVAGKTIGELLGTRIKRHVKYAIFNRDAGSRASGFDKGENETFSNQVIDGEVIDIQAQEVKK